MASVDLSSKRKYIRPADFIIVFLIIVTAIASIIHLLSSSKEENLTAVIRVDSEIYAEVSLADIKESYKLSVPVKDGEVVVRLSKGGVEVLSSPCSDKLCVHTGKLTKSGQSAVCLPTRVSVQIISNSNTHSVDAVVG